MKKLLSALLATGFLAGYAGAGYACPYHSAEVEKKLTLAQSEQPVTEDETAISTHDPNKLQIEGETKVD